MKSGLAHVYWLGGSPCAGKSAVAEALAGRYNLRLYRVDDATAAHQQRATAEAQPAFFRLNQLGCDELWMRPLAEQVASEINYCADQFALVVEDLLSLPNDTPILAEGTSLLPRPTHALLADSHRALWLTPTSDFQRTYYAQRPWIHEVLRDCTDPDVAFQNWMARDVEFARWVAAEAEALGLRHLLVDGTRSLDKTVALVAAWFGLARGY